MGLGSPSASHAKAAAAPTPRTHPANTSGRQGLGAGIFVSVQTPLQHRHLPLPPDTPFNW